MLFRSTIAHGHGRLMILWTFSSVSTPPLINKNMPQPVSSRAQINSSMSSMSRPREQVLWSPLICKLRMAACIQADRLQSLLNKVRCVYKTASLTCEEGRRSVTPSWPASTSSSLSFLQDLPCACPFYQQRHKDRNFHIRICELS